ncbi:hypothetical protein Salat_0011100 [Sesamum alatum]|uniref:Uncharacterized protein n=1 Tax=Sesamum alatum TaxID=300844 RepID=A0AAE2CW60_9LAMI|nr:hypothetical protein Salat_0011100 [Sesamum alatum]
MKLILHSIRYGYKPKKSEVVHRLWELADSEEAIIYLSDCRSPVVVGAAGVSSEIGRNFREKCSAKKGRLGFDFQWLQTSIPSASLVESEHARHGCDENRAAVTTMVSVSLNAPSVNFRQTAGVAG